MTRWEYRRWEEPDDKALATLGDQGWELVAVCASGRIVGGSGKVKPTYVFKREKSA